MSTLVENVQKVVDAHAGLSAAIASKGVDVPANVKLSQMPELVQSIEVREPLYIPNTFNFNGWLSGEEDIFNMHLDATKPITIDPTKAMSYEGMFQNCLARSIVVPELTALYVGETYIGGSARNMFRGASLMSSFTVPKGFWSKRTDCTYMLSGCSSLSSIDMSEEDGGALSGMESMNYMFNYCTSLTSIEFPEGSGTQLTATRITGGFQYCTNLQKLVFPAGFGGAVKQLWKQNLTNSKWNLKRLEFGAGAFPNLTSFEWLQDMPSLSAIDFGSEDFGLSVTQLIYSRVHKLSSLELPDNFGLSSKNGLDLGYYGVYDCQELTSLKLPANVRCYDSSDTIHPDACRKLTHITFPTAPGKSFEINSSGTRVVFPQCSSLQHLEGNLMIKTTGTLDISHLTQLDHSSLLLIINGLYDYVAAGGSGTRYIKLGDANLAKLSDEDKAIITSKGWTIV